MTDRCVKHPFESAVTTCRECGHGYCAECLVYSFGAKKPPFCVQCALAAAGVRRSAAATPVRAQKSRRLFGRREPVVVQAAAPTFDDIPITFPEGLIPGNEMPVSEIAPEVTRRPAPPIFELEPEPVLVGAEVGDSLSEWGAALEDSSSGTSFESLESLSGYGGTHDSFDSFESTSAGSGSSPSRWDADPSNNFSSAAWPESTGSEPSSDWNTPRDADWSGAAPWPPDDDSSGGSFF